MISVKKLQAATALPLSVDPLAEPSSSNGINISSTSCYDISDPESPYVCASAPYSGHQAVLPLAVQDCSNPVAKQPVANSLSTQSEELAALAAHCRSVFENDAIIRSSRDRRFNSEYQDLHDEVPRSNLEIKEREIDLNATLDAFRQYSEVVSELIILQQQLPADMRPIKAAADLGGMAGGEKFKVGHVVFKFARDWQNIYGTFVVRHAVSDCFRNTMRPCTCTTRPSSLIIHNHICYLLCIIQFLVRLLSFVLFFASPFRLRPGRIQSLVC